MMKKKISTGMIVLLMLTGCASSSANLEPHTDANDETKQSYEVSSFITPELLKAADYGEFMGSMKEPYTPENLKELATDIAIIKVINIKKSDMDFFTFVPSTYGEMLVNDVIHGSLENGEVIPYVKPGGIVTLSDYEKKDHPEAIEKRDYLREKAGKSIDKENTYLHILMENDIDIEEGKTYLAYLVYHSDADLYEMVGLETGLREVNVEKEEKAVRFTQYDRNDLKIKNNETGEFESLTTYIDANIE